jgi:hypothetical protein
LDLLHEQPSGGDRVSYPSTPGSIKGSSANRPAEYLWLAAVAVGIEPLPAPQANSARVVFHYSRSQEVAASISDSEQ